MEAKLVEKGEFRVMGRAVSGPKTEDASRMIGAFWQEWIAKKECGRITGQTGERALYGLCLGWSPDCGFTYMIGRPVTQQADAPAGMAPCSVAGGTYAVFVARGPVPEAIQATWQRAMQEWLPESGWQMDMSRPSFERYDEDRFCNNNETEIWLAVSK